MIIGFLGKGGSGKSTLSSHFVRFCHKNGKRVLAIDADHNMDMSHNLLGMFNVDPETTLPYFGNSLAKLMRQLDPSSKCTHYSEIFLEKGVATPITLTPPNQYFKNFSLSLNNTLSLMVAGPHTEQILRGETCSHSLFTPLKILLPLLSLGNDEVVIVDEKAGRDGAGTGVTTGVTLAVVCAEPTPHSIKAANQIAELLEYYKTPYVFVMNKTKDAASTEIAAHRLKKMPLASVPMTEDFSTKVVCEVFFEILSHAKTLLEKSGDQRLENTVQKFSKKHVA